MPYVSTLISVPLSPSSLFVCVTPSVHFMNRRCRLRLVSAGERDDRGVRRLDQKVVGRRRPKGVQERLTAVVSQAERGTLPKRVRNEDRLALLPVGTRHGVGVAVDEVLYRQPI